MLSTILSRVSSPRGALVEKGVGDLLVAVSVVVEHPGCQADGGIRQGVADRLSLVGLLHKVAPPDGSGDCIQRRVFLLREESPSGRGARPNSAAAISSGGMARRLK
jgi:hypothetical protein